MGFEYEGLLYTRRVGKARQNKPRALKGLLKIGEGFEQAEILEIDLGFGLETASVGLISVHVLFATGFGWICRM